MNFILVVCLFFSAKPARPMLGAAVVGTVAYYVDKRLGVTAGLLAAFGRRGTAVRAPQAPVIPAELARTGEEDGLDPELAGCGEAYQAPVATFLHEAQEFEKTVSAMDDREFNAVSELSWVHHIVVSMRDSNPAKAFYLKVLRAKGYNSCERDVLAIQDALTEGGLEHEAIEQMVASFRSFVELIEHKRAA